MALITANIPANYVQLPSVEINDGGSQGGWNYWPSTVNHFSRMRDTFSYISMTGWFCQTASAGGTYRAMFSIFASIGNDYTVVRVDTDDHFQMWSEGGTVEISTTNALNTWYPFYMIHDRVADILYGGIRHPSGEWEENSGSTTTGEATFERLMIGEMYNNNYFEGPVQNYKIWPALLSPEQLKKEVDYFEPLQQPCGFWINMLSPSVAIERMGLGTLPERGTSRVFRQDLPMPRLKSIKTTPVFSPSYVAGNRIWSTARRQPAPNTRLDKTHPIVQKMGSSNAAGYHFNGSLANLVYGSDGGDLNPGTGIHQFKPMGGNIGISFDNTDGATSLDSLGIPDFDVNNNIWNRSSDRYTFLIDCYLDTVTQPLPLLVELGATGHGIGLAWENNRVLFVTRINTTDVDTLSSRPIYASGGRLLIGASYNKGLKKLWVNGSLERVSTTQTAMPGHGNDPGVGAPRDSQGAWAQGTNADEWSGIITQLHLILDEEIPDTAIQSWTLDPWQIYEQNVNEFIYKSAAAAASLTAYSIKVPYEVQLPSVEMSTGGTEGAFRWWKNSNGVSSQIFAATFWFCPTASTSSSNDTICGNYWNSGSQYIRLRMNTSDDLETYTEWGSSVISTNISLNTWYPVYYLVDRDADVLRAGVRQPDGTWEEISDTDSYAAISTIYRWHIAEEYLAEWYTGCFQNWKMWEGWVEPEQLKREVDFFEPRHRPCNYWITLESTDGAIERIVHGEPDLKGSPDPGARGMRTDLPMPRLKSIRTVPVYAAAAAPPAAARRFLTLLGVS